MPFILGLILLFDKRVNSLYGEEKLIYILGSWLMLRMPSLKSLHAFRCAAEAMSFKDAAERLHVTPTAISQQIKTLESELGLLLFKRKIREVELTPEGRQLLAFVSQGFKIIEDGVAILLDDPNPNRLVLSALPSFSSRFLIPRLGRFHEVEKDINLHLLPSMSQERFEGSDVELAIRFGTGDYPNLKSSLLLEDYVLPVCHTSLVNESKPIIDQLKEMPILFDDSPDMKRAWQLFQDKTGLICDFERSPFKVSDATMLIEALVGGQGFSLVRYSLVYDLLAKGHLISPMPVYMESLYKFYLVAPDHYFKRAKVRRFEVWLRQEVSEIEQCWAVFLERGMKSKLELIG